MQESACIRELSIVRQVNRPQDPWALLHHQPSTY